MGIPAEKISILSTYNGQKVARIDPIGPSWSIGEVNKVDVVATSLQFKLLKTQNVALMSQGFASRCCEDEMFMESSLRRTCHLATALSSLDAVRF